MAFIARSVGSKAPSHGRRAEKLLASSVPAARWEETSGSTVRELVVVPLKSVADQFPAEALSSDLGRSEAYVQVTPVADPRGRILFRAGDIQATCPHLFQPGYRLDADKLLQIPDSHVFLGVRPSCSQLS